MKALLVGRARRSSSLGLTACFSGHLDGCVPLGHCFVTTSAAAYDSFPRLFVSFLGEEADELVLKMESPPAETSGNNERNPNPNPNPSPKDSTDGLFLDDFEGTLQELNLYRVFHSAKSWVAPTQQFSEILSSVSSTPAANAAYLTTPT
eukprot:461868-Pyramimonas_sp.AAC.1